ncbi:hypothetical protein BD410DRAFT_728919 [Rickenella mellea]|uniref:BTB domain-containing protein n=1 Tax=Rickenella mellea TaxID=50990 RepID=A0A4Y7PRM0_9AGAM|nr:hypothetical protein BD410DRAFT_728919 [Rickenella mellea]
MEGDNNGELTAVEEPSITRSEPWFEDGNIVVITERTAFCVHKAQLARQSEVFAGMFTITQPTASDISTFEGRDVVHVHDAVEDLKNLLTALYDGVDFNSRNLDDFLYLAGIARLSTKYMIHQLRQRAIRYLISINPVTHERYKEWAAEAISREKAQEDGEPWPYVHSSLIIRLAKDINAEFLLPCAFYRLTLSQPKHNFETYIGTRSRSLLSSQEMFKYVIMDEHMRMSLLAFVRGLSDNRDTFLSKDCESMEGDNCYEAFDKVLEYAKTTMVLKGPLRGPDGAVRRVIQFLRDKCKPTACSPCTRLFIASAEESRRAIWDQLPGYLGLPGWAELIPEEYK